MTAQLSSVCNIPYVESVKIIFLAILWGTLILVKTAVSKVLRVSQFEWDERENPPSCLTDASLGQHSYVKLKKKGIKLHYVEAGDRGLPVLLLLHGFPDCWIGWHNQIPVLSDHYRVIALDLKGFGDSDKPQNRRAYKIEILLEELSLLITSLGVNKCVLVGHGIGALLGWYMVHLKPQMIVKFVAISCPHPNVYWSRIPKTSKFNTKWIHFSQMPFLPELDAMKNDLALINQCYQHLPASGDELGNNYIDAYKYTFSRLEDWTSAINYYRTLPFCRINDHELRQVEVPCLLISGKKDPSVMLESVVKSTEYVQKYSLKIIEDAYHYAHQERPNEVNRALMSFLIDIHLVRKVKTPSPSLIKKTADTISGTVKYGSDVFTTIKNDPNTAMLSLLSKALYFGKSNSNYY